MKKIYVAVGLVILGVAGLVAARSLRRPVYAPAPAQNQLGAAPEIERKTLDGQVEATSSPEMVEIVPRAENPQPEPSLPPSSEADEELPVVVPAPQPVADFLLAVRDFTDQIQMSDEETTALSAFGNSDQLLPEAILTSLEAKARRGISESEKLADLSETAEIKSSLLQLYSSQVNFYKVYRQQSGKNEPVDLKELIRQWYAMGVKCDELRYSLHQKYGLGRL